MSDTLSYAISEDFQSEDNHMNNSEVNSRNSYSVNEKLHAIALYDKYRSLARVSRETGVHRKCIRRWVNQREELVTNISNVEKTSRKRLSGGGRKALYPEIEGYIYNWLLEQHSLNLPVRHKLVQQEVHRFMNEHNMNMCDFKASICWINNFCRRHNMSISKDRLIMLSHSPSHSINVDVDSYYTDSVLKPSNLSPIDKPLKQCYSHEINNWFQSTFPSFNKSSNRRKYKSPSSCAASSVNNCSSNESTNASAFDSNSIDSIQ
jgi:hypothetical protein